MVENQDRIRVWNEETGEMMEPATIQEMLSMERNVRLEGGWAEDREHVPEDYGHIVFMRNTGIFAQSRKEYVDSAIYEIFDGDLITHSIEPYVYRVVQKRGCWFAESLWPAYVSTRLLCRIYNPRIVGNVFEDKELVRKGEIIDDQT